MGRSARQRAVRLQLTRGGGDVLGGRPVAPVCLPGMGRVFVTLETMGAFIERGDFLAALGMRAELVAGVDALTVEAVAGAVSAGASWRDVGAVLGVSKQAAHQRWATSNEQQLHDAQDQVDERFRRSSRPSS